MKEKIKTILKSIFLVSIVLTMAMYWYDQYVYYFTSEYDFLKGEHLLNKQVLCPKDSNVAVISINGDVVTYSDFSDSDSSDFTSSEEIVFHINKIEQDDDIKALIVEIDSYGGYAVASEEIMDALKRMTKPTVAVIREGATSGGYLVASGADKIYASEMSDVGGIGITASYLDYSQQIRQDGVVYQELSSGRFKDTGDPNKELTFEERELIMRDIKIAHDIFIRKVSENRGLDIEEVEKLADGSTMLGKAAKENGLIDEIGNIYSAEEWIKRELGIDPVLCLLKYQMDQCHDFLD